MDNPHKGHRERLKARFLRTNGTDMEEHELLELLLFYSIPRKNTNETAHALIRRFGSVKGVLNAKMEELACVEGVGANSALMLKAVHAAIRRYLYSPSARPVLSTVGEASRYVMSVLYGLPCEELHLFCLDASLKLIGHSCIGEGGVMQVAVNMRQVIQAAISMNAAYVLLAHNHPGGSPSPSVADVEITGQIATLLSKVGVTLSDHIITSDDDEFYSFSRKSSFHADADEAFLLAEQYGCVREK